MRHPTIDLNADLGEGFGAWKQADDAGLLQFITSANIACGYHAGDPVIMQQVCELAVAAGVTIGAHVGYRDLAGFGRRFIDVEPHTLSAEIVYQVAALDGFARIAGARVAYIKPHGALYNTIVANRAQAGAVVDAVGRYDPDLPVLGLSDSVWLRLASKAGLRCVSEAFADRAYTAQGTLVPRNHPESIVHDADTVVDRVLALATRASIATVDGRQLVVDAESICLHGDTPGAVDLARRIRTALDDTGITVEAFSR